MTDRYVICYTIYSNIGIGLPRKLGALPGRWWVIDRKGRCAMAKSHIVAWASGAPTPAQLKEFFGQIDSGRITKNRLQSFLRGGDQKDKLKDQLADWEEFYKEVFGLEKDFSELKVSERRPDFSWLLVVAEGMTSNRLFQKISELMPSWRYADDLDVIESERKADKDYAIWVRDSVEVDEEHRNKSTNDLKHQNVPGITLEERLLYELKYYKKTNGGHLDLVSVTLCSGSRGPGGSVPHCDWGGGGFEVDYCNPGCADAYWGAREAVS